MSVLIGVAVGVASAADCPVFLPGQKVGVVQSRAIREASGLAASRKHKGVLWTHNDHGGTGVIYALSTEGRQLGAFLLKGAQTRDWEDIAIGPGPDPNVDYIYVGDIGDNDSKYESIAVYRIPEPVIDPNRASSVTIVDGVETIKLQYPDGSRNAETLMIDPLTKDLYIVSKENSTKVYLAAWPQSTTVMVTLEKVGAVDLSTAVGGDISPDGTMVVVRGYFAASLWMRAPETPVQDAFKSPHCRVPLILEPQGEAICFDADGTGYYTTSEKRNQPIYYFSRRAKE